MAIEMTKLQERIESGGAILIAEISPPACGNPAMVRDVARRYVGKVHALGIDDNRRRVCMSALAAASLVAAEGVEPILHIVTRDRNRIALISECLGAEALGIRNLLCTTGTHQILGRFKAAKNVFDIDSIQFLQACSQLAEDGSIVGEDAVEGTEALCLGGTAAPDADPLALQAMRMDKKVSAGAKFLITQPVFDTTRFNAWWKEVSQRGIPKKTAIVAGIAVLSDADRAKEFAESRPKPLVPEALLQRITSKPDAAAQRAEGIAVAVELIEELSAVDGLRGFAICGEGDDDAVLEVIEKSGLEPERGTD